MVVMTPKNTIRTLHKDTTTTEENNTALTTCQFLEILRGGLVARLGLIVSCQMLA